MPETQTEKAPEAAKTPSPFVLPTGETLLNISFAELEDIAQNHPADYSKLLLDAVDLAKKRKGLSDDGKEITKEQAGSAKFYGKLLVILARTHDKALAEKTTRKSFNEYVEAEYGELPVWSFSYAKVFGTFVLAPEKSARLMSEKQYNGQTRRAINAASKCVNIAEDIHGETPETSGLNHQVFTDMSSALKLSGGADQVKELESIQSRLVWIEENAGGKQTRTLKYLTLEELAAQKRAKEAQDEEGKVYNILTSGGLAMILGVLNAELRTSANADYIKQLIQFAACAGIVVRENRDGTPVVKHADGTVTGNSPRFNEGQIQQWADEVNPEVDFADLPKEVQAMKYQVALQVAALYEEMNPEQPVTEKRGKRNKAPAIAAV